MELTRTQKVSVVVVSLAASFAAGRFATPAKVVIKTETVTVEKLVKDDKSNIKVKSDKHYKTVKTETTKPDGTKVVTSTTTIDDGTIKDTKVDDNTNDTVNTDTKSEKTVVNNTGRVTISALAGISPFSLVPQTPFYGAQVQRNLLGPVVVGVFGLNTGQAGISLGLQF